jgi:hypothetical protein
LVATGTNLPIAGQVVAANNKKFPPPEQAAGYNELLFLSFVSEQFPLPAQNKNSGNFSSFHNEPRLFSVKCTIWPPDEIQELICHAILAMTVLQNGQ